MFTASIKLTRSVTTAAEFTEMFDNVSKFGDVLYATLDREIPETVSAPISEPEKPKATRAKKETAPASPPADASSAPASSTPSTAASAPAAVVSPSDTPFDLVALRALITNKIAAAAPNRMKIQDLIKANTPDGKLSSVPTEKLAAFQASVEAM